MELPLIIGVIIVLMLMTIQLALMLLTSTAVAQAARDAARVAATATSGTGADTDELLTAVVLSRLRRLSAVPALMVPGSLEVTHEGTPRSALVRVKVQVYQRPLPLVGWAITGGAPVRTVKATGEAPGGEAWVAPGTPRGEVIFGAQQKP